MNQLKEHRDIDKERISTESKYFISDRYDKRKFRVALKHKQDKRKVIEKLSVRPLINVL